MPYQLMHSMMAMQSLCNAAALGASVNVISCQFENTILFSSPLSCVVCKELAVVRRLLPSLLGIAKSSYISRRQAFRLASKLFSTRIVNRGSRRRQE